ncbi:MAG TPA: hypothetical protein VFQ39_14025, partial [Longimicrobium sp.]|nr:hypothetical protein [Longimicrobium sp.]
ARMVLDRVRRSPALAWLAGACIRAALALMSAVRDSPRHHRGWILPELPAAEAHRLWLRVRRQLAAAPSRDADHLYPRYVLDGYRLIGVRERGGLVAMGAIRPPRPDGDPRLNGVRVATLSEILCPPDRPDAARALLATAEQVARGLDADALLCGASHRALDGALRRRGYLRVPGSVHVLHRAAPGDAPPPPLAAWWLTRGDSLADEGF